MSSVYVLIPTWNRAQLLRQCLDSVLRQTRREISVIVYDDGSTDDTRSAVTSLQDARLAYIRGHAHCGVTYARNALLECARVARAEYACWQDSDDLSSIYRVELQLRALMREEHAFVTTAHARLTSRNAREYLKSPRAVASDRGRSFASTMFRVADAPQFIDGVDCGGEDIEWTRALLSRGLRRVELQERLYYVRLTNSDRIGYRKIRDREARRRSEEIRRAHRG